MKRKLRIFQVIGIVSLVTLITAVSCGKTGGGGNSGGNGGGDATIVITNLVAASFGTRAATNPVKVEGTNISMRSATFDSINIGVDNFDEIVAVQVNTTPGSIPERLRVFDFVLSGASGGLMMVAPGNVASIGDFEAPALAAVVPAADAGNEGIFLVAANAKNKFIEQGLNVYGVFMSKAANATYAFSRGTVDAGTGETARPHFYCRAVVPEITTTTPAATATLKGGEKSECYISYHGYSSPNNLWLGSATRQSIEIAVGAVRTDGKKLSEMGFGSATEFSGGLSKADMAKLAGANKAAYKKYKVTIVADDAF